MPGATVHETELNYADVQWNLVDELDRGLTYDGCIGFHGTTIDTLMYVINHGIIPGRTTGEWTGKYTINQGDIHFWPIDKPTDNWIAYGGLRYDPIKRCEGYAGRKAADFALLRLLGLSVDSLGELEKIAGEVTNVYSRSRREMLQRLVNMGYGENQVEETVVQALKYKGIIVGLDQSVINTYILEDVGKLGDDGWRISTRGRGLPYRYIRGIKLLGPKEREFLDSLGA